MKRQFNPPEYYWKIAEQYIEEQAERLKGTQYYLDKELANLCIEFTSILRHTAGEFAGVNFQLLEWQIKAIVDIFATKYRSGKFKDLRRYQRALFFMSKKNGKSELAGVFHSIMFFLEPEKAKEQYSIATEAEQAKIIHKVFLTMIKQEPELFEMVKSTVKPPRITKEDGAFTDEFQSLTSSADTKDGLRPSFLTIDEGHAFKNKELYQILSDGLAGRQEPLELHLSTAGYNKEGFFYRDIYQYAKKVQEGIIKDDRFYYVLFEPTQEDIDKDDWENPDVWERCNPNLGNSPTWSYMEGKVSQARESEESLIAFKTKHLNWWCDKAETWIPSDVWANEETFNIEDFKGESAYYGLDLSSTTDISSLTLMFKKEEKVYTFQKNYIPKDNIKKRVKNDRVPYFDWIKEGHITPTEGNVIDYGYIEKDILELNEDYPCHSLGYDSWNSSYIITRLEEHGIETVPVRQGFATLSPACKEFEVKVIKKEVIHNNSPVMNWALSNVVLERDSADNIKLSKKKSIEKIDPIASTINCMVLYILDKKEEEDENYYDENDLMDL